MEVNNMKNIKSLLRTILGLDYFSSPLDLFLEEFDATHPKLSASQRKEVNKYARIYKLRDDPKPLEHKDSLWENF
jgi:hypothetical protein